jgi:hypothetical protein
MPHAAAGTPPVCEGSVKTAMPSGRAHRRVQSVVQNAGDYPLRPAGWRLLSRLPDARCALRHVTGTPATGRLPSNAQRGLPLHPAMVRRQFNDCQTDGCQTMVDKGSVLEARWPQSHNHSASSAAMALNSDRRRPGGRGRSRVTAHRVPVGLWRPRGPGPSARGCPGWPCRGRSARRSRRRVSAPPGSRLPRSGPARGARARQTPVSLPDRAAPRPARAGG